jgi:hypothetical protein
VAWIADPVDGFPALLTAAAVGSTSVVARWTGAAAGDSVVDVTAMLRAPRH